MGLMQFSWDFNGILMGLMWLKHTSNGLSTIYSGYNDIPFILSWWIYH